MIIMQKKPGPKPMPTKKERRLYKEAAEKKILTILSMNGRASFNLIGSMLGIDRTAAYRKVKAVERKYNIRYIAEIDVEKLGFLKFMILAKFPGKAPDYSKVKEAAESFPQIQFAFALEGWEYQYIFYALSETNSDAIKLTMQLNSRFGEYECELHTVPFYETYNFVPLRDEFIDMLKERISKRQKGITTAKGESMLQREFAVLKELNKDGSAEFSDIDKKYGFDMGRSQYSYYRLLQKGLIKRITITMDAPLKYIGVIFMKITRFGKFSMTRARLLNNIISDKKGPLNRYLLVGDINAPNGVIFFAPCTEEGELEDYKKSLEAVKGTVVTTSIIAKRILGDLCFRRFDNAYSEQEKILEEEFKIKTKEKTDYSLLKSAAEQEKGLIIDLKELKNKN